MNRLSRLLSPTNVVLDLSVTSKKRLFEQVGLLFENNHGIERSKVFDSLFARERLGSTGLGEGVAIPHGRIKGLNEALAAVVRLAEPIAFDAPDGKPVSLLVFLLVPEAATEEHLDRFPNWPNCSRTPRFASRWPPVKILLRCTGSSPPGDRSAPRPRVRRVPRCARPDRAITAPAARAVC